MRHVFDRTRLMTLVMIVLLTAGCQSRAMPSPTPALSADVAAPSGAIDVGSITALGTVRPAQSLQLGFLVSGPVRTVMARVGTTVRMGDVLAELDTAELALAVEEAENGLMLSQAQLDQVRAGAREPELAIAQAKYDLALARHDELQAGASSEEIAVAEADCQGAVDRYERIQSGASQGDLNAAQARLDEAQVALARAQAAYDLVSGVPGIEASAEAAAFRAATAHHLVAKARYDELAGLPSDADLQEARAEVSRTQADHEASAARYVQVEAGASPDELIIAKASLEKAEIAMQHAQAAYDQVASSPGVAASPQAAALQVATIEYQAMNAQYEALKQRPSQAELAEARARVTRAQLDHEAALMNFAEVQRGAPEGDLIRARANLDGAAVARRHAQAVYELVAGEGGIEATSEAATLRAAKAQYAAAVSRYEELRSLPNGAEMQEARASVIRAQAQLELKRGAPTALEVRASATEVAMARSELDMTGAGPRPEDEAVAEARVRQARTTLERARLAFSRYRLLAPFSGIVSEVHRSSGEWAAPGVPILELVDTSGWLVETRNVSELDIARVRIGQAAIVQIISLPGKEVGGRLNAISPVAAVQQGDTTYTVIIELEPTDLNLRPGMNAKVEILTD